MAEKTKEYRFRAGVGKHAHKTRNEKGEVTDRRELKAGDKVPLTDSQYEAFRDKFDPVEGKDNEKDPPLTPTQPQTDPNNTALQPSEGAKVAAEDTKNDKSSEKTGAGAASNSENVAKAPQPATPATKTV